MKTRIILVGVLCACILFSTAGLAEAEHHSVGPYPNYEGTVEVTTWIVIPTVVETGLIDPFGNTYNVGGRGGQEFEVKYDKPIFAASYLEFDSEESTPFNPETGFLTLTEIWAVNLAPGGGDEVPPLGGFEVGDPEIIPLPAGAPEGFYIGKSKTVYTAPVQTVEVEQLSGMLPLLNTMMITSTSPGSIVYVSQVDVPASDFVFEQNCSPAFLIDSEDEWQQALDEEWPLEHIRPLESSEWDAYRAQWEDMTNEVEGIRYFEPYPDTQFLSPELYVYEGNENGPEPNDAGLVMRWGDAQTPSGNYAGAYKYDFGLDPDLTNCTIQITVTAPQFGPSGQINQVSFSIVDIGGLRRSWWWQVGPAGGGTPIEWNVSKTVKINTAVTGLGAANPIATGFLNTAGFNLTQSQSFDVDENGQWIFGQVQVPPPGSPTIFVGLWNYWHNLTVTQNTKAYKGSYPKWTQGPVVINEDNPPLILGWDEPSDYNNGPVMADDWECSDERPVTDIHWWGSFLGWTQPELPPILPKRFHIGIWTDVPVSAGNTFSHPGALIWENYCDSWVWNFAGYDEDPRPDGMENEACFQFNQLLSQDEWFHQHPMEDGMPNVYWLSIAAIYDAADYQSTDFYPWGWKTREHFYNDDAVRVMDTDLWPIRIGSNYTGGNPVELFNPQTEQMESWDLAFELTTNEELPQPPSGDVDGSGLVDFSDLAILADQWLTAGP